MDSLEVAFVGSLVLTNGQQLPRISGMVSPTDLDDPLCVRAYEAMLALGQALEPIDTVTVAEQVRLDPLYRVNPEVIAFIDRIYSHTPSPIRPLTYGRLILERAVRREVEAAATKTSQALNQPYSTDELLARVGEIHTEVVMAHLKLEAMRELEICYEG